MFARFLPQTVPFFELLVQQNALLQEMSERSPSSWTTRKRRSAI